MIKILDISISLVKNKYTMARANQVKYTGNVFLENISKDKIWFSS